MTQAIPKLVTFEEFVDRLPENSSLRYELHNGEIVEMAQPVGDHEEVKSFLGIEIPVEIKRLGLPYGIPNQVIVKPPEKDSGYFPDVLVVNFCLARCSARFWYCLKAVLERRSHCDYS